MQLIDTKPEKISLAIRGAWHFIQDIVCLAVCILTVYSPPVIKSRAENLFLFLTIVVAFVLLFKVFRNDEYVKAVEKAGTCGIKYRCFYSIYYTAITFICASQGGFWGYAYAVIWILSGGSYLLAADKIAKDRNDIKEKVAVKIATDKMRGNDNCPYCKSSNYKEAKVEQGISSRIVSFACKSKGCKKTWSEVYELTDIQLLRREIPIDKKALKELV